MYLSDWEDTYPTNYNTATSGTKGKNIDMPLSINSTSGTYGEKGAPKIDPTTGKPIRFVGVSGGGSCAPSTTTSGPNWVEALYNYIEVATIIDDPSSIWKCPAATVKARGATYGIVSYLFNACLVECGESAINSTSNQFLLREEDGMYRATVRPNNYFSDSSFSSPPAETFCNGYPTGYKPALCPKLHANGSHILFADGHVKLFDVGYFPTTPVRSTVNDATKGQWFNFVTGDKAFTIAITPNGS